MSSDEEAPRKWTACLPGGRDRAEALRTRSVGCEQQQDGRCGHSGEDKGSVARDVFREAAVRSGLTEPARFCKERSYRRVLSKGVSGGGVTVKAGRPPVKEATAVNIGQSDRVAWAKAEAAEMVKRGRITDELCRFRRPAACEQTDVACERGGMRKISCKRNRFGGIRTPFWTSFRTVGAVLLLDMGGVWMDISAGKNYRSVHVRRVHFTPCTLYLHKKTCH